MCEGHTVQDFEVFTTVCMQLWGMLRQLIGRQVTRDLLAFFLVHRLDRPFLPKILREKCQEGWWCGPSTQRWVNIMEHCHLPSCIQMLQ
jgi:hypothetical protein